jgi:hypothetical protein
MAHLTVVEKRLIYQVYGVQFANGLWSVEFTLQRLLSMSV